VKKKPMSDVRLIERWLPIAALGEESIRERRSMTALPPIYYLHVWWARRPLVASRAAILASLLPEPADHGKFMQVLGIHGDPVGSRRRIDRAKRSGVRFEGDAYSYDRAFSYCPTDDDRNWLKKEVGRERTIVVDPTAGGGSIPFEGRRLGVETYANDLNPVAAAILSATIDLPMRFGFALVQNSAKSRMNLLGGAKPDCGHSSPWNPIRKRFQPTSFGRAQSPVRIVRD
jgi:putative DNA methylase